MVVDLQKADVWKRIAAWLLDAMLLCVMVVGMGLLLSSALDYDGHYQKYESRFNSYMEQYQLRDVDLNAPANDGERQRIEQATVAMRKDTELIRLESLLSNLMLVIVTFSILLTMLLFEFVIPLWLKNGQTIGKKLFALGLIRIDGVKLSTFQLFARTVLGKFTIETMIPVYVAMMAIFGRVTLTGLVLVAALILIQLICLAVTSTNSAIHDLLASTIVVDISSQKIFGSSEELIEYKKQIHAEQASRKEY